MRELIVSSINGPYLSSFSALFCCSAVASVTAPVEVRSLYLRLQLGIHRHEYNSVRPNLSYQITQQWYRNQR